MKQRIAIIGSGPIGLEAGLAAKRRGYRATIYERGEIADSVRRWGHVRMFSPFSMNASAAGVRLLRDRGHLLPADEAYITGAAYAEEYLEPLGRQLGSLTWTTVKAISREGSGKRDKIGESSRSDTPFRLLIEHEGVERHEAADVVFDCSGVFQNPNPLGDAGVPALGESGAREFIRYGLGETSEINGFAGLRILVAGGGHSAANLMVDLAALKRRHASTEIHWIVKGTGDIPCARVPDDPLAERDRICAAANEAVNSGNAVLYPDSAVIALARKSGGLEVTLQSRGVSRTVEVDRAIAVTGFRPDWGVTRELHVQTCWATEGTYPLAASLLGETGGDCLAVPAFGAEALLHPEPNFFPLGAKSYGRTPDFLISNGLKQIESVLDWLERSADSRRTG
jgi:threonine dehydrogenase-like Zn-dependent dehydrogenase